MNDLQDKRKTEIEIEDPADGDCVVLDLDDEADPDETAAEALRAIEEAEAAPRSAAGPSSSGGGPSGGGALEQQVAELKEQQIRTLADFENFRKRSERERRDLQRYALLEPMRDLLSVIDNLERALAVEGGSVEDLKTGVEMTLTQFRELMGRHGIQAVEAVGQPFDPAVHDAVSRFEHEEVAEPTVADEFQKGYLIHDRLLRPAMVRVAMPSAGKTSGSGGDAS